MPLLRPCLHLLTAPLLTGLAVSLFAPSYVIAAEEPVPVTMEVLQERFTTQVQPLLEKYCYDCHGDGMAKGKVALDKYPTVLSIQANRQAWLHIADTVGQRVMPPEKKPQPTDAELATLSHFIGETLDFVDLAAPRDPGRVTIHRLNRTEYNNTIRDLLGVTDFKPADDFPADDTGYGFDNIADVLSMSPLLAEKYLAAAEQVLDKALGNNDPLARKKVRYLGRQLEGRGDGNSDGDLQTNGAMFKRHNFPAEAVYEIRIRAAQDKFGDEDARMALRIDREQVEEFNVAARRGDPRMYIRRVKVPAGEHRVAAAYTNNAVDSKNPDRSKRGDRNLHIDFIEIDGPFDAQAAQQPTTYSNIFFKKPGPGLSDDECAHALIEHFASRAFRRPVSSDELNGLMDLYKVARTEGKEDFEGGVKLALTGVLVSPHFLFRIEHDPVEAGDKPHPVSPYELATRLSYFLWSSMPDDQLLSLAKTGTLSDPKVLDEQTRRMLADPKAAAFVTSFVGQWLEIRNLESHVPDETKYPAYDEALRISMQKEAELFFQTIIKENRSILELLNSDYTFVNERLAKHYGIEGVKGDEFRKVSLEGTHRGGVLTMGGVLTVTAMPTRTSPVKRGKFVLEKLLASAPPPPPADVPALNDKPQAIKAATMRERLEKHRENPNCSVCHMRMDPIGFALENFDAIGKWRDMDESKRPIDAGGKLPEGETLDGAGSLRDVLVGRKDQFVDCLIENLLTYALGRGLEQSDRATVKVIGRQVKEDEYRFGALVSAIVHSEAFGQRRGPHPPEQAASTEAAGR